jgi:hypothetical protein
MSIEPIGFATVLLGFVCLFLGQRAMAIALICSSLLAASAALFVGGNPILPTYVLLGFALLSVVVRPKQIEAALMESAPPRPAFWLLCLVTYGVASSFFMPRLMAGMTDIVPLGGSALDAPGATVPLTPVSSNLTQSFYMTGNLLFMLFVMLVASSRDGFRAIVAGLVAFAVLNTAFAALDIVTYATGTQSLLEFMRNANYTMHYEEKVFGLKRIVGSFVEASSFARTSIGVFCFTATLWLCKRRAFMSALLAGASFLLVLLSTSSAGLALLPVAGLIVFLTALEISALERRQQPGLSVVIFAVPVALLLTGILIALGAETSAIARDYVDLVVLNKMDSDSGIERSYWNAVAVQNIIDTWGVGVGLGTNRTSSLLLAIVSNLGVVGLFLYLAFVFTTFIRKNAPPGTYAADVRLAARNACLGLIAADTLTGTVIDQGFFFYALAGLAAARPDQRPS